jgi:hypothetical protein
MFLRVELLKGCGSVRLVNFAQKSCIKANSFGIHLWLFWNRAKGTSPEQVNKPYPISKETNMKAAQSRITSLVLVSAIVALAMSSLPAAAVEWSAVANTETQTVLVDRDSVHAFDGDVRAWVIHSHNQTESLGDMYAHRSKVMLYSFACDKPTLGYMQWSMQSGQFGGGQTVWADRTSYVTHYEAGDDVADNALVDSVCAQYARMTGTTYAAAR